MRYRLQLTAFDIADSVAYRFAVVDDEHQFGDTLHDVLERGDTVQGVGEPDPKKWARAVLLSALSEL